MVPKEVQIWCSEAVTPIAPSGTRRNRVWLSPFCNIVHIITDKVAWWGLDKGVVA
jgi:hypothetical protein